MLERVLKVAKGTREKAVRMRQNVIPDVLDNLAKTREAPKFERSFKSPKEAAPILERLCPEETRRELHELVGTLDEGTWRARVSVGSSDNGTKHPHDFVIEKQHGGTFFYFVDPEHFVGERNMRRPAISNLMELRLPHDTRELPSVSITRFRTPRVAERDITELKMARQLKYARQLIDNKGIPELVRNEPQEIIFRVMMTPEKGVVQSRYVDGAWPLELFLEGATSASALEGKVVSQQAVLSSFVHLLKEKQFEPIHMRTEKGSTSHGARKAT